MVELPQNGEIEEALERALERQANKPLRASEAYKILADAFALTADQRNAQILTASGRENLWENRCRTARENLAKKGWMRRSPRDAWAMTQRRWKARTELPNLNALGL